MENYPTATPPLITTCQVAVRLFLNGWINGLQSRGYSAGVYGNVVPAAVDFSYLSPTPDDIWITLAPGTTTPPKVTIWNLAAGTTALCDIYSGNACSPLWSTNQRIHQYLISTTALPYTETWGGQPITIDPDTVDAAVAYGASGTKTYNYNFTAFYPNNASITYARGINNIGIADPNYGGFINGSGSGEVGQVLDNVYGFLYNPNVVSAREHTSNVPPAGFFQINCGESTVANGINNNLQVVGYYLASSGEQQSFSYNLGTGTCTALNYPSSYNTEAYSINDAGQVSGSWNVAGTDANGFAAVPQTP